MTADRRPRAPAQMWLPALKPALIFECVGVPGVIQQIFEGAPAVRASSSSASAWKPTASSRCSAS